MKAMKATRLLLMGLTILLSALFLSLLSMTVHTAYGYVEKEVCLEPSKNVYMTLNQLLPARAIYFNMSIRHSCDRLSITVLRYVNAHGKSLERVLYRGEELVLTNLKRWEAAALSFTSNNSCKVNVLLAYTIYVRPFIWLAIPSFILAIVGSAISLCALISIITLHLKSRRVHVANTNSVALS